MLLDSRITRSLGTRLSLLILCLVLVSVGTTGCIGTTAWVKPTTTATYTPQPTVTLTATATPTNTPVPTSTPTPLPIAVDVNVTPSVLAQGQTAQIRVMCDRPATVRGTFDGNALGFVAVDALTHVAYVGVSAIDEPGSRAIWVEADCGDGQRLSLTTSLVVVEGTFETETLVFDPDTEALLDPAITRPEYEQVMGVYGQFSTEKLWEAPFAWPVESPRITSQFGTRRQYGSVLSSYHAGLDLGGETGTPVYAAASGVVALAAPLQVRGNVVIIDHGAGVYSGYFHLDTIGVVVGQTVTKGEQIGNIGATGLVTGSHLHWEMRVAGVAVSPTGWLQQPFDSPTENE